MQQCLKSPLYFIDFCYDLFTFVKLETTAKDVLT